MNNSLPKVLVISSNPFSKTANNGKTLSSFFEGYDKSNVAQLCFSGGDCNEEICDNYYFFTNSDALNKRIGRNYSAADIEITPLGQEKKSLVWRLFNKFSQARKPFASWIKNKIWGNINGSGIYKWINEFNPDVVFFQGFSMSYGYEIALSICEKYKLPLVLELTDDYTEKLYKFSILEIINKNKYLKLFKKAISYAYKTIVISPKMKKEYEERFGGSMQVMMNSVEISANPSVDTRNAHDYVYAGNVLLNRWKILINFAKALHEVDEKAILSIYTTDVPSKKILQAFEKEPAIRYEGSLGREALKERLNECGVVVFVESFDELNKKITRLSLSTKVPEYMASGALIVAIGPKDVGSMEYLEENKVAVCIFDKEADKIKNRIKEMLSSDFHRNEYINRAYEICKGEHSIKNNAAIVRNIILSAYKN